MPSSKLYEYKARASSKISNSNKKKKSARGSRFKCLLTNDFAATNYTQAVIMRKFTGKTGIYNVTGSKSGTYQTLDISVYRLLHRDSGTICVVSDFDRVAKSSNDLSEFIFKSIRNTEPPIKLVVYASADLECARKVVDAYRNIIDESQTIKTFIYGLKEDAVHTWPDNVLVDDAYAEMDILIPKDSEDDANKEASVVEESFVTVDSKEASSTSLDATELEETNESEIENIAEVPQDEKKVSEINESDHTEKEIPSQEFLVEPVRDINDKPLVENVAPERKKAYEPLPENVFTVEELIQQACDMVKDGKDYCALALLKAYDDSEGQKIYKQFAYAANDPTAGCCYTSNEYFTTFTGETILSQYLGIATAIRIAYYDSSRYDYDWKGLCKNNLLDSKLIENFSSLKGMIYELIKFKQENGCGIDALADFRTGEEMARKKKVDAISKEAEECIGVLTGPIRENASCPPLLGMQKLMFASDQDLVKYLVVVRENDTDKVSELIDFMRENFLRENGEISLKNIDKNKMEEYINLYWELAKDNLPHKIANAKLTGAYNRKIVNKLVKVVGIMCRWLSCQKQSDNFQRNGVMVSYRKTKPRVIDGVNKAMEELSDAMKSEEVDDEVEVGLTFIVSVLKHIKERMTGRYIEAMSKYYYMDFLYSDQITLDESCAPVINRKYDSINGLSFYERLQQHMKNNMLTPDEAIEEICNGREDYGTAAMIYDMSAARGEEREKSRESVEANISYAADQARDKKREFIDNLDYMESEGQIDNFSTTCNKDIIQGMVEEAFIEAKESHNYGFFEKVLEACREHIMVNAQIVGDRLKKRLKEQLKTNDGRQVPEGKLAAINKAIEKQEYTIAEDGINRLWEEDYIDEATYLPKDYLDDFVMNYDKYYKGRRETRRSMVHKDKRGANQLRDNWLCDNYDITSNKLRYLLEALEFDVEDIQEAYKGKNYKAMTVTLRKPIAGGRFVPKHCISAFGSEAVDNGFRVITICGNHNADSLLEWQKKLSSSYHTLVLLDWSLNLSDRRRLARKIKESAQEKIFAVLDKVMLSYLMENYTKDYMNQMLMSLLLPYSYYQPYTPSSSVAMPVEMFIGRRDELIKIKDSKGPQLVYGGRQLGKSALLRMAEQDVDHDERGSRAVLVDIKDMSVAESAKVVGHRLAMDGIIDKQKKYAWDDICNLIQERLHQEDNRIPYLLLLLDEGDTFIQDSSKDGYKAVEHLKKLQEWSKGRFKFVIAGLHNIVRHNRKANDNNGIITHLSAITIKPFAPIEARELLKRPLEYLGIYFPKDDERLSTLIIANANYFPGLIQLYCKNLIECMKKDYAGYNEEETPPYRIQKAHIQKILNSDEFKEMVREKFEITLKLDKDNYYYIIALLLASLYHGSNANQQFSAEDILAEGREYGIAKLKNMAVDRLKAFMEELCELNILRPIQDGRYSFSRYKFFQMMGTQDEIDNKLLEFMA